MGGGSYSYDSASVRASSRKSFAAHDVNYLDREVFTKHSLDSDMNIKGKIRESRDNDEHPNSYPIIIALDVTGSMGFVPKNLIQEGFPEIMKKIMDEGVENAQVCFIGIGDAMSDSAPIQVGQFETSDELTEKWLKDIYLEGGGGGNGGESYSLAWYVAARCTSTDSFEKRGKKGVLITIGDEPYHKTLSRRDAADLFGGAEADIDSLTLLKEAQQSWDVYHINVKDWSGISTRVHGQWAETLGDHLVETEGDSGEDIPNLISGIILKSYNSSKGSSAEKVLVDSTASTPSDITGDSNIIL